MNKRHNQNLKAPDSSLGQSVLNAIEEKHVAMRPKWHFALHVSLLAIGTILASLTLIFLVSFIVFSLRQNGSWFVIGFGSEGWMEFIRSLPWLLIILALGFIIILGILVKKYSFSYGRPLLYSALGIILFAGLGGFLLALTPLHSGLFDQAVEYRLPLGGQFYRSYSHAAPPKVVTGIIVRQNEHGYMIYDQDQELLLVLITPYTKLPRQPLSLHDLIVVLGDRHGATIEARGIECLSQRHGLRPLPAPAQGDEDLKNMFQNR